MRISQSQIVRGLLSLAFCSALFNPVLIGFGIEYLYIFLSFAVILACIAFGLRLDGVRKSIFIIIYIFSLVVMLCISVGLFNGSTDAFVAFGLYCMPLLVWVSVYSSCRPVRYFDIFSSSLLMSGIIGYLALLQYFFSPTLFGLIAIDSNQMKWADGKAFIEYATFFRATSTLGSPQVLALFCGLTLILSVRYKKLLKPKVFYFSALGLAIGGALSGGKSFFLIVILFFLLTRFRDFFSRIRAFLVGGAILLIIIFAGQMTIDSVPALDRVFSLEAILAQENNDSRLVKYLYIFNETNPLYGNGLGSITNKSAGGLRAAESYIFKIYYEAGIFPFLIFIILCFISLIKSLNVSRTDFIIIFLTILGMLIVHAFESPVFIIIWGYFLGVTLNSGIRKPNEIFLK
jgi:hypothetical protein